MSRIISMLKGVFLTGLFLAFCRLCSKLDDLVCPAPEPPKSVPDRATVPGGVPAPGAAAARAKESAAAIKAAEEQETCTAFIDCNGI